MIRKVYILGIDHGYQRGAAKFSATQHAEFDTYVRQLVSDLGIKSIAEEASNEALLRRDIPETTVKSIAEKLGVFHAYCDPESKDRARLGIVDRADLFALRFTPTISEVQAEQMIAQSDQLREQFWLTCIDNLAKWPLLFVCGATHSTSFCDAATAKGYSCVVVAEDWPSHG